VTASATPRRAARRRRPATRYVTTMVITPLFLVSGTFFPIDQPPEWAQVVASVNRLYHCVELVRHAVFGFEAVDPAHLGVCWLSRS
jgi:lipooligosaccharide transport system permease protein